MSLATKARVLVVEDERIVAMDLQQTLAGLGYDAYAVASSATEAVRAVTHERPDVILMDIRIKGDLDGVETANLLRQRFELPVIFLTAHADDATISRATASSPYGYLLKPVKATELRSAIEITLHRCELERKLRESERWLSTTLHSLDDGVVRVGLDGRVSFINPAAEALLGRRAADVLGLPSDEVLQLEVDDRLAAPLTTVLRDGRAERQDDATLVRDDGLRTAVTYSASAVDRDGELLGAVMVFRDVSHQRQVRKQLELTDRLASLGTMAAGVAHEINNPLSVLSGNVRFAIERLGYLLEHVTPELKSEVTSALDALVDLRGATERIGTITGDLQMVARRKPKQAAAVDVRTSLDWALRSTAHALRMKARVIVEMGELPAVVGDEHRLGQVFVNLLINASHAIEDGAYSKNHVTVRGRAIDLEHVAIEVTDTGCGMPPDILKRIFEPFYTTKAAGIGTGLGLSICHGIIADFGGAMSVRSVVGGGTTFTLTLRIASDESAAQAPPTSSAILS